MTSNCEDKIKLSCPPSSPLANCVKTEVIPPTFSSLINNCNSVQEVEVDMYAILAAIKLEIDLTAITSTCTTFPTPKNVKTLIQQLYNEICAIKAINTTQASQILTLQTQVAQIQANPCN